MLSHKTQSARAPTSRWLSLGCIKRQGRRNGARAVPKRYIQVTQMRGGGTRRSDTVCGHQPWGADGIDKRRYTAHLAMEQECCCFTYAVKIYASCVGWETICSQSPLTCRGYDDHHHHHTTHNRDTTHDYNLTWEKWIHTHHATTWYSSVANCRRGPVAAAATPSNTPCISANISCDRCTITHQCPTTSHTSAP